MDTTLQETEKNELLSMPLPNNWIVYLYDKQLFRDISGLKKKPHTEICRLETVNDAIYFIQLMSVKNTTKLHPTFKLNLDMHDYIVMREGIEPIWEDPKNCNGGTFTIKMPHSKGFTVWSMFMMYMLGETMTYNMEMINGITVSYIADGYNSSSSSNSTYVKIWDAATDGSVEKFTKTLPRDLYEKIKPTSNLTLRYTPNTSKKNYGNDKIIEKISDAQVYSKRGKEEDFDNKQSSKTRGGRGGRGGNDRGGRGRGGRGGYQKDYADFEAPKKTKKTFTPSRGDNSYNSHGMNLYDSLNY